MPVMAIPVIVSQNGRGVTLVVDMVGGVFVAIVVGNITGVTTTVVGAGDCAICGTIMKFADLDTSWCAADTRTIYSSGLKPEVSISNDHRLSIPSPGPPQR